MLRSSPSLCTTQFNFKINKNNKNVNGLKQNSINRSPFSYAARQKEFSRNLNFEETAFASSIDKTEARLRVLNLYRNTLKLVPWMKKVYFIEMNEKDMTRRIEAEFRKNVDANSLDVIDKLIFKAELDFKEMYFHHMQRGHISKWFAEGTSEHKRVNSIEEEEDEEEPFDEEDLE